MPAPTAATQARANGFRATNGSNLPAVGDDQPRSRFDPGVDPRDSGSDHAVPDPGNRLPDTGNRRPDVDNRVPDGATGTTGAASTEESSTIFL
jgi:hypothetical protein